MASLPSFGGGGSSSMSGRGGESPALLLDSTLAAFASTHLCGFFFLRLWCVLSCFFFFLSGLEDFVNTLFPVPLFGRLAL